MRIKSLLSFLVVIVCLEGHKLQAQAGDTTEVRSLIVTGKKLVYELPDSSLYYFKAAERIAAQTGSVMHQAESKSWIGVSHYILSNYDLALPYFIEARHLYDSIDNHYGLATSYNHIGLIYQTQLLYEEAIEYHKKGIYHAKQIKNLDRECSNNFNIALALDETGRYDSAIRYLDLALQQSQAVQLHRLTVMSLNRLGKVNYHMRRFDRARDFYLQALQFSLYESNWEKCFSWAGLAEMYQATGDDAAAIQYATKSFALAKSIGAKWDMIQAGEILAILLAKKKNFTDAYEVLAEVKAAKDSVFTEDKENKLNFLHLKENELTRRKLEQENAAHAAELKQQNQLLVATALLAALLLSIILFVVLYHRQKNRLNRQLTIANQKLEVKNKHLYELNETKNTLFSIISHDMRAPFNSLRGMLELLRMGGIDDQRREEMMGQLSVALGSVSATLDNLLQWANSQMTGLRTNPQRLNISELIIPTIDLWQSAIQSKDILLEYTGENQDVFVDRYQIKTVIRNILGNAIKFTDPQGKIRISSSRVGEGVEVVIQDNGIGMDAEMLANLFTFKRTNQREGTLREKGSGVGLMISHELLVRSHGTITVESVPGMGTTFKIWLPSKEHAVEK